MAAALDKRVEAPEEHEPAEELVDVQSLDVTATPTLPGLAALRLLRFDEETGRAVVLAGDREISASVDGGVDAAVMKTALAHGERVAVQQEGGQLVVIGALRTRATPGIDEGDDYTIAAKRIRLEADHAIGLRTGRASISLRAQGLVETLGRDITTRASSVHKLIGRLLRLN
ncbi:MAG: hypothetical protein R3B72_20965 [Polyangiaceae bacterium]